MQTHHGPIGTVAWRKNNQFLWTSKHFSPKSPFAHFKSTRVPSSVHGTMSWKHMRRTMSTWEKQHASCFKMQPTTCTSTASLNSGVYCICRPALKRTVQQHEKLITDNNRKIADYKKNIAESKQKLESTCQELGIPVRRLVSVVYDHRFDQNRATSIEQSFNNWYMNCHNCIETWTSLVVIQLLLKRSNIIARCKNISM